MARTAEIERKTKETEISVKLNLDGSGESAVTTGIGFFDHMLDQVSRHSLIDLDVKASGDLQIDLVARIVAIAGHEVQLTPKEYDLLHVLVNHAGMVLTHRQILKQVWGDGYESEFHMLHVNISNLRHKLEPDPARPSYVITEPGVGYRLRG